MALGIFDCLNFTTNTPVENKNEKLPVLDTKMWAGPESGSEGIPNEMIPGQEPITVLGINFLADYSSRTASGEPLFPDYDKFAQIFKLSLPLNLIFANRIVDLRVLDIADYGY